MGWTFKARDSQFSYIFAHENMIGAIELSTNTFKPSENGPLMYFRADFMEATLNRVSAAGGKITEKTAIEGGARGYTARIRDPFNNTLGFWAPEN